MTKNNQPIMYTKPKEKKTPKKILELKIRELKTEQNMILSV